MDTDKAKAALLLDLLKGLQLDSADGRAGIAAILREIEELAPGSIGQMNAALELRRMGCASGLH